MASCPSCRADLPENARFCPGCGHALSGRASTGATLDAGSSMITTAGAVETPPKPIDHGQFVPGTLLGERYRVVGLLGRGGMGEVYRADDLTLHQTVALKFLPRELAGDERRLERLRNEVRVARQVSHPNVCRVYDIGEIDGRPYLSMEYIDGEDLSSLLRRIGRLPKDKATDMARQICAGLTAAHEKGVVHRDLKPMNVMIDGRGKVRITDFGLAALLDDDQSVQRGGTPAYMAPEQLKGRRSSVRSDLYSLGLVLYEAYTGRRAFDARTINELTRLHDETTPTSPSRLVDDVDPIVERVIMRCLEREPSERPPTAVAVAAALPGGDPLAAALLAGETPSPDLVAAAADVEGMPPVVCLACLIVILLGLGVLPFLSDQVKLHALAGLSRSPAVLEDTARTIARELGYGDLRGDSATGWVVNDAVLARIESRDLSTTRWSALSAGGPASMEFWFRASPAPLIVEGDRGSVRWDDPEVLTHGQLRAKLDPKGRLVSFLAVPPATDPMPGPPREPDWDAALRFTGMSQRVPRDPAAVPTSDPAEPSGEPAGPVGEAASAPTDPNSVDHPPAAFAPRPPGGFVHLVPATPERIPPVYCDRRAAWTGRHPEDPDVPLRVEAGSWRGRLVYLDVLIDAAEPAAMQAESPWLPRASQVFNVALLALALIGGGAMARKNLELGRGDRRGAWRIAVFVALCMMLAWALQAHHVANARQEFGLFSRAAGRAMFIAGICWLLYIALEPHVRRRWPDMLIGWSRLLAGRLRDPMLGRDILIGGLFGMVGMALTAARHFGPGWVGWPPPRPTAVSDLTFLGLRYDAAELLNLMTTACLQPMVFLVLLLLLLVMIRERFTTMIAFHLLVTGALTFVTVQTGGHPIVDLTYHGLLAAALIFVLMRFGLLAVMLAIFVMQLLENYPITSDFDAWYADSAGFAILVAAALSIYGYVAALGGRRILGGEARAIRT